MYAVNPPTRPLTRSATCPAGLSVGDVVSISGPATGRILAVDKTDITTLPYAPAIGIIKAKPTPTTCRVVMWGCARGVYMLLSPGTPYYVGTDSRLTATKPSAGNAAQVVAIATSLDELYISPVAYEIVSSARVYGAELSGAKDGVNQSFTLGAYYTPGTETVDMNGRSYHHLEDYSRVETGGVGTGYNGILLLRPKPPRAGDDIRMDYDPA